MVKQPMTFISLTNTERNKNLMAIHPVPDTDFAYMSQNHGTSYLITDPRADRYLAQAHREKMAKLKERKTVLDSWTI